MSLRIDAATQTPEQQDLVASQIPPRSSNALHEEHLQDFKEFFDQLNAAAKSVLPKNPRRYSDVHVLLVRWEDDDLGTEKELDDLEDVLRNVYCYSTERYLIPSDDSMTQLEYRLNDFRKAYDSKTTLLILYYGGHGIQNSSPSSSKSSIWQANLNGGPTLVWSDLQPILQRAKSDLVYILDCCYAGSAVRGGSVKEGLWACNSESLTVGVSNNSFTRNLIEELKALSTTRFDITMLHNRLMGRYGKPGPHQLLVEPVYSRMGNAPACSIELTPLQPRHASSAGPADANPHAQSQPSKKASAATPSIVKDLMTEPLALLAVRLKDPSKTPRLSSWQNWCHEFAPDDVESVHALGRLEIREIARLEANFLSNSALVLFSVPFFIWDRLLNSPCYSFVGIVKSPNLSQLCLDCLVEVSEHKNAYESFMKILIKQWAEEVIKDPTKTIPALHWAARSGERLAVQALIEKGLNLGVKDDMRMTALHVAAKNGHMESPSSTENDQREELQREALTWEGFSRISWI